MIATNNTYINNGVNTAQTISELPERIGGSIKHAYERAYTGTVNFQLEHPLASQLMALAGGAAICLALQAIPGPEHGFNAIHTSSQGMMHNSTGNNGLMLSGQGQTPTPEAARTCLDGTTLHVQQGSWPIQTAREYLTNNGYPATNANLAAVADANNGFPEQIVQAGYPVVIPDNTICKDIAQKFVQATEFAGTTSKAATGGSDAGEYLVGGVITAAVLGFLGLKVLETKGKK